MLQRVTGGFVSCFETMGEHVCMVRPRAKTCLTLNEFFRWEKFMCLETWYETVITSKIMCGIIGYIGKKEALPLILDGLKNMEYRGYDSAGVAIHTSRGISSEKAVGRIMNLETKLDASNPPFGGQNPNISLGIGHTRWATHGGVTEANTHPHTDCTNRIWLVHNGIIENYRELRDELIGSGHRFQSETD